MKADPKLGNEEAVMELIQTVVGVLKTTAIPAPKEAAMQIKLTLSLFQVVTLQMDTNKII